MNQASALALLSMLLLLLLSIVPTDPRCMCFQPISPEQGEHEWRSKDIAAETGVAVLPDISCGTLDAQFNPLSQRNGCSADG